MRQNRHWGRRLAALALTAALTGSAAPALAAGDYWDVDRLDWYYAVSYTHLTLPTICSV